MSSKKSRFRENPGIMTRKIIPDYARCVEIVTAAAQKELLGPGMVAVATPVCDIPTEPTRPATFMLAVPEDPAATLIAAFAAP